MSMAPLLPEDRASVFNMYLNRQTSYKTQKPASFPLKSFVQQEDEVKHKKTRLNLVLNVLDPDSRFMIIWRMVNLICIYIYLIELPIALVFENTRKDREHIGYIFQIINVPCIIIFLINMIIKMKLPFYQDGIMITDSISILKNYFKFMFALDIISIVTITAYEINQTANQSEDVERTISKINMLFYVKIVDVFQINKLNRNVFQLHRKTLAAYNIIILFMGILLISNLIASTCFEISQTSCFNPSVSPDMESCWVLQTNSGGIPVLHQPWYIQYVYSLYWASTTMLGVGYGDIYPRNAYEVAFTIAAEYLSCAIFAYSINEVWQIFKDMRQRQTKHQKQFNIINRYMRDRKVKSIVANKVKAYLNHYYRYQRKGEKDKQMEIIEDLAPAIKQQLLMDTYGCVFKFPIFSRFSSQLFQNLVFKVQQLRYPEGEIIQSPDFEELNPTINYIFKGSVIQSLKIGSKIKQLKILQKQNIFGQYQFFTGQITRTILTTSTYCSIYLLKQKQFMDALEDKDYEEFFLMRHSALYLNNIKELYISCALCESDEHISEQCCISRLRSKWYSIIKNYRTSINTRCDFVRPHRRLVNKLVSRNQLGAIIRMIRKNLEQKQQQMQFQSLNQSYQESQPIHVESFIEQSVNLVRPYRKNRSQVFFKNNRSRGISMNQIQMEIQENNQRYSINRHRAVTFRELVIGENLNIDEIENYEYYFKQDSICKIIKKPQPRKINWLAERRF